MTKSIVTSIHRTGSATSVLRHLVVQKGEGKNAEFVTLSTPITKVSLPEAFAKAGGKTIPIEQYGFKVGAKTVQRFADAAALVFKRHFVTMSDENIAEAQIYVKRAFAIVAGTESLREVDLTAPVATVEAKVA